MIRTLGYVLLWLSTNIGLQELGHKDTAAWSLSIAVTIAVALLGEKKSQ